MMRVYELAKELGYPPARVLSVLQDMGYSVPGRRAHMTALDDATASQVRERLTNIVAFRPVTRLVTGARLLCNPPRPPPPLVDRQPVGRTALAVEDPGWTTTSNHPRVSSVVVNLVSDTGDENDFTPGSPELQADLAESRDWAVIREAACAYFNRLAREVPAHAWTEQERAAFRRLHKWRPGSRPRF